MQISAGGSDEDVSRLTQWVFERTSPGGWRDELDQVLSIRARNPGGLWYWTPVVVQEQLLWALPRNGNFSDLSLALAAVGELLTVIDQHPLADLSEPGSMLAEQAAGLEAEFARAMGTKGRWGPSRRMMTAMGVDLSTVMDMTQAQRRLDRATRQYNQLSSVERARIGGPSIAAGMTIVGHDYLPLAPAPVGQCQRQASQSRLFQQIWQLTENTRDGIALTAKGNLPLAAGRELVQLLDTGDEVDPVIGDRTFKTQSTQELRHLMDIVDLAKAAGLVTKRKTILRASGKARTAVNDPVDAVAALLAAAVDQGWHHSRDANIAKFGAFAAEALLLDLYEVREPMTLADILGIAGQRLRATFDLYDDTANEYSYINGACEAGLLSSLDSMQELGVLSINPPGSLTRRRDHLITAHIRELRAGEAFGGLPGADSIDAEINLTELGLALVQPFSARHGNAPLVEPVEGQDPVKVLAIAASRTGENGAYELTQWLLSTDPNQRAALVRHGIDSPSELARSVALRALIGCDEPATSATLAALAAQTGDGGQEEAQRLWAWTLITESEQQSHTISLQSLDDDRWVTLMSETIATLGLDSVLTWLNAEPAATRAERLERVWRLDRPEVADALAAAAEHDPDPTNRKQARKSLFKLRQRT